MFTLCKDAVPVVTPRVGAETSSGFLATYPRGAYTTARSVNGCKVFEFDAHVQRIAQSCSLMLGDQAPSYPSLMDEASMRRRMGAAMAACIKSFSRKYPSNNKDIKLVALVVWGDEEEGQEEGTVYCHASQLVGTASTPRSSAVAVAANGGGDAVPKPVIVEVRGHPRNNALAKDSQWVKERESIVNLALPETNEVIMHGEDGELLEGTQTNFYAIINGAVHTAADGILEGTVRKLILEVCAEEGIEVVLQPPRVQDIYLWEGVLISSTSRLAMPVDTVVVPQEGVRTSRSDPSWSFKQEGMIICCINLGHMRVPLRQAYAPFRVACCSEMSHASVTASQLQRMRRRRHLIAAPSFNLLTRCTAPSLMWCS
ncbi:unnamed protein product, partial [Chrysoparadoxa australica]